MNKSELSKFKLLVHLSGFKKFTEVKIKELQKEYRIGSISLLFDILIYTGWIQKKKEGKKTFIKWSGAMSPDEQLVKLVSRLLRETLEEKYPYLYDRSKRKERELQKSGEKVKEIYTEGEKALNFDLPRDGAPFDPEEVRKAGQLFLPLDDISSEDQLKREALQRLKIRLLTELSSISAEFQKKIKELSKEINKISLILILCTLFFSSCGGGSGEYLEAGAGVLITKDVIEYNDLLLSTYVLIKACKIPKNEEFESLLKGNLKSDSPRVYALRYHKLAQEEERLYNIPSSITLAQGILESSSGSSGLCISNKNHFGIKCFSRKCKKGHCTNYSDDSHKDFFKVYSHESKSFRDHSLLLQKGRYKPLKKCNDYKEYARGLQSCGYATSKTYAKKLIRIIQKYDLTKYDLTKYDLK